MARNSVLDKLRSVMATYVPQRLEACVIPHSDAHQNEYIADADQRLAYVSGFTGSAGIAVVTHDKAALWTDGRYYLQANKQLSDEWILMKKSVPGTATCSEWLLEVLPEGSNVGADPYLMSDMEWKTMSKKLLFGGQHLVPLKQNLVDVIWENKPPIPSKLVFSLPIKYTGLSWEGKVKCVREEMKKKRASILILCALDEIAWLFNLRGSDIEYNPVFFAYTVVKKYEIHLFIDEQKLDASAKEQLSSTSEVLHIHPYESISDFLSNLAEEDIKVWVTRYLSHGLAQLFPKSSRIIDVSPIALSKAVKNRTELNGMKNAHIKDAVAICGLYTWLEKNIRNAKITEISVSDKLEEFRREQDDYIGPSFPTISASGPNASVIHYRPTISSDRNLSSQEMHLCDCGAQFRDGTTDVTRTWHFDIPSSHQKECYTRVLKGHIALSSSVFPNLTKGHRLDAFARKALWDVGLDYLHGTGHGVGSFLNVHEGPLLISERIHPDDPGLQEGMILSIEPGYYEDDQFGIRIENLAVVVKAETKFNFRDTDYLTFEPLTLVPMQTKMIEPSMLTAEEIKWLNDYHLKCREVIGSVLQNQGRCDVHKWLMKETLPLG